MTEAASASDTAEDTPPHRPTSESDVAAVREAIVQGKRVAGAAYGLFKAEVALARASVSRVVVLVGVLVLLALAAWFALNAVVIAAVQLWLGSFLAGALACLLLNAAGIGVILVMLRSTACNLSLPRTREAVATLSSSLTTSRSSP